MAGEREARERDLVLDPAQHAFILDETKGNISVYVGPAKTSLANTDRPVRYSKDRGYDPCKLEEAIRVNPCADEGSYLVLENPADEGKEDHPHAGSSSMVKLNTGRKVNLPGPISFPLWPGQTAKVIPGHHLRSNQYLVVRVYNEEQARTNWAKRIVKPSTAGTSGTSGVAGQPPVPGSQLPDLKDLLKSDAPNVTPQSGTGVGHSSPLLTVGQLLVIKGTDVSFFIPPTGIEVVPDEGGTFVRSAITLERLEYCILLDEGGNKRFVRGPDVVFPSPTETFVKVKDKRKFRAIDLNELSGLYIKVIAPYDEDGRKYEEGEELFITGKDQMIYFPRPEHAIIRYGDTEIYYATAIPTGEARYVMDRETGVIGLTRGPSMFLPDPRKQAIVKRILEDKTVALWFPGNSKALEFNQQLAAATARGGVSGVSGFSGTSGSLGASGSKGPSYASESPGTARNLVQTEDANMHLLARSYSNAWENEQTSTDLAADDIQRKLRHTPPRMITMDTKYDGAVAINVWTGYSIMVVNKKGERKVVQGPATVLLEYDEILESMELSTGTPKTDNTVKTAYLRVANNKISDIVQAVTKDMVQVSVRVSYRVNFEGDPEKWFNVENYVKFLTEHLRSLIRNVVKQNGIESFNDGAVQVVRDVVLGKADAEGKRTGRIFAENGMRVYDVEILDVMIGDSTLASMLATSQQQAVRQAISIAQRQTDLEMTKRSEAIQQQIDTVKSETTLKAISLRIEAEKKDLEHKLAQQLSNIKITEQRLKATLTDQDTVDSIAERELERKRAQHEHDNLVEMATIENKKSMLVAEAQAIAEKAKSLTPEFIAALQAFGDKVFVKELFTAFAPHSLLQGHSIADVFAQVVGGTPEIGAKLGALMRSDAKDAVKNAALIGVGAAANQQGTGGE